MQEKLTAFTKSKDFSNVPLLKIQAHLFASILTRIRKGRLTQRCDDVDALSAYAPYMDVVCTDAFMAGQLRCMTKEYGIMLFHAKNRSLHELKAFLENYLCSTSPIRRPSITAFVLPPKKMRDGSFKFSIALVARYEPWHERVWETLCF